MDFSTLWDELCDVLGLPQDYPVINLLAQGKIPIDPIRQSRSSTCGLVAAKTVLSAFGKTMSDDRLSRRLRLCRKWGVSTAAMIEVFRGAGLRVGRIKPNFRKVIDSLEQDALVLATVRREVDQHWLVVFDADIEATTISISGDRLLTTHSEPWKKFRARLGPDLLVISKK